MYESSSHCGKRLLVKKRNMKEQLFTPLFPVTIGSGLDNGILDLIMLYSNPMPIFVLQNFCL